MRCCPATVRVVRALCLVLLLLVAISSLAVIDLSKLPKVVTHDNLKSAGVLKDRVLTVHLELKEGAWHPDADDAPAIPALTITEEGAAPSMPGPMIRVPEGTRVHVFFKNTQFFPVFVFGLNQRPGDAKDGADLPEFYRKPVDAKQTFAAGETYDYIFEPTKPGKLSLETNFALSHIVVPIDVVATQTVSKK